MLTTWMAVNTSAPAPRNRCMSRTQAGRGRRPSSFVLRARPQSTAAANRTQATRPFDRAAYHSSLLLMRSPLGQQPHGGRVDIENVTAPEQDAVQHQVLHDPQGAEGGYVSSLDGQRAGPPADAGAGRPRRSAPHGERAQAQPGEGKDAEG